MNLERVPVGQDTWRPIDVLWVILSPGRMDLLKYAEMKVDLMKVIWRHEFAQDCLNIQETNWQE